MEGCLSSYPVQALREKYLYNLFHSIIHRTRTDNLKICIETQKILISQRNLEKEKRSWKNQAP